MLCRYGATVAKQAEIVNTKGRSGIIRNSMIHTPEVKKYG